MPCWSRLAQLRRGGVAALRFWLRSFRWSEPGRLELTTGRESAREAYEGLLECPEW
jgi:hypothetical protein